MGIFYLLSCKVTDELHGYYFTEETLIDFQLKINEICKQYRYLW